MHKIILSWPDKSLSPNARSHWAKKAKAAKLALADGYYLAQSSGWNRQSFAEYSGKIHVYSTFYAKTRNFPDADNMLASIKNHLDGIAKALGVNDARFVHHPHVSDLVMKNGVVEIILTQELEP